MKILYLHGLYSKPGGFKPTYLRRQGYERPIRSSWPSEPITT
jgi:hypothetical protein